ncbi:hypothetical protein I350_02688 [Cryptococcus amylolentus CBS 6273]|uniref:1-acyl-sn-glycerol-3-phosphate acyltransferase n=1 Tax=Cryptococcus amylolentus CBS 6273 TaxID=1296118 RepID=A0A1E3K7B1_9TREE|nr:hypothetical protein I350_02688 [Cryptococcus amylolentus CBS 6273]
MALGWLFRPLALASTVAFSALGALSTRYQRARLYWNLILYLSALGMASAWGIVVTILATASGQRFNINYYVARTFYNVARPLVGIRIQVEGEEHLDGLLTARGGKGQSAVLLGNHQSMLDILYLGRILPKRSAIMAKKELKWSPVLGQFMSLSGAVFVDRKNRTDAVQALAVAGEAMKKKGVSLWVFPEGTRTSSPESNLLPFKKGAFHLAVQAQVPIVPVVCENYYRLFDGRTRFEPGVVKVRVLEPIPTIGLTVDDVTSLAESTREAMLQALREISVPTSSSSGPSTSSAGIAPPISAIVTDPPVGAPIHLNISNNDAQSALRQRLALRSGEHSREASSEGSKRGATSRDGETTEDEMDEDAVLMKKPTGTV